MFYFLFGVLLYDIWHLTSALLAEDADPIAGDHTPAIPAAELADRVARHLRAFG